MRDPQLEAAARKKTVVQAFSKATLATAGAAAVTAGELTARATAGFAVFNTTFLAAISADDLPLIRCNLI